MGPYFFNQNIKEDNMINKEDLEIIIEELNESAKSAENMYCKYKDSEYTLKKYMKTVGQMKGNIVLTFMYLL